MLVPQVFVPQGFVHQAFMPAEQIHVLYKMDIPKLRRQHAGYLDESLPVTWDAILLYDTTLSLKIGRVKEDMRKMRVPPELARLVIEFCRRIDFRTTLDLTHRSNADARDFLLFHGCNIT